MEKNIKKNVYMCITESLFCIAEMNTMLQINYTSINNNNKLKDKKGGHHSMPLHTDRKSG